MRVNSFAVADNSFRSENSPNPYLKHAQLTDMYYFKSAVSSVMRLNQMYA